MKTESIVLQNLCVPCGCHCRYCLLSWDGRLLGIDYARSERYARRFYEWLRENRPELQFHFSFGYSMEHPQLPRALDFLREIGSVSAEFLQCDGLRLRSAAEAAALTELLREKGVKRLNFTFYGTEDYHDRFAGRAGDFAAMLRLIDAARGSGLDCSAGVPLSRENADQAEALLDGLEGRGLSRVSLFVPHAEGRGASLNPVRFSTADWEALSPRVQKHLNTGLYRPEGAWLREEWQEPEKRMLLLSLTPENIERLETTPFAEVIAWAEGLDEAYYGALPAWEELARTYGDSEGTAWYSRRDLLRHYQRRHIAETGLRLYDVTDERQCGSRRY